MAATVCSPKPFINRWRKMFPTEFVPDWMAGGRPNPLPLAATDRSTLLRPGRNRSTGYFFTAYSTRKTVIAPWERTVAAAAPAAPYRSITTKATSSTTLTPEHTRTDRKGARLFPIPRRMAE